MRLSVIRAIACAGCAAGLVANGGSTGAPLLAKDGVPTIRQQVRDNGAFERLIVTTDNELQMADLVLRSDLIVEALNADSRTYLDEAADSIYTDYSFNVHAIIKNSARAWRPVGDGDNILVRREDGTVIVDGRTAEVHENNFPPFTPKERYMLFLTEQSEDVYSVLGGAQGAFVAGDRISPMRIRVGVAAAESTIPRAAFFGDLQALLRFSGE